MTERTARVRRMPRLDLGGGFGLRPWTTMDAPQIALAMRDPLVRRYAGTLVDDRATAIAAIHTWNDQWPQRLGAAWAICDAGQQVVGSVRFGAIAVDLGLGSVGYWVIPEGRGQRLASRAVRAATPVVFDRLGWHRIELYHAVENERSCAVARRSGYLAEGVMRSAMRYPVDGRRSDEHLHARLVTDPEPD